MNKLLTLNEIIEITRLSKATIYAYVAARKIPFIKIGARVLFSPDAIQEWINQRIVKPVN